MKPRKCYTTGQVARMLGISSRKVCQWVDAGQLAGFRLVTASDRAGDRRIAHADLLAFARRHGIPLPFAADGHILWMGKGGCDDLFSLATMVAERKWMAVVLDLALVPADLRQRTVDQVRGLQPAAFLAVIVSEDGTRPSLRGLGRVLFAPVADAAIRELIEAETGGTE